MAETSITLQAVEEVVNEWLRENPDKAVEDMPPSVFADRMMKKVWPTYGHGEEADRRKE